jgi:hypothetical protein
MALQRLLPCVECSVRGDGKQEQPQFQSDWADHFVVEECLPTIQGSFERVKPLSITTLSGSFRGLTFELENEGSPSYQEDWADRFVMDECLPTIQGSFERVKPLSITTLSGSFRGLTFELENEGSPSYQEDGADRFVVDECLPIIQGFFVRVKTLIITTLSGSFRGLTFELETKGSPSYQ